MGEASGEQASASYSWWLDTQKQPTHQSQWLQTTLSDLDEKIRKMVELMEGGGDSFAKRAEMYYNRRPQLIKMIQDIHKSYHSLAEKYDQLRYESASSFYKIPRIRRTKSLESVEIESSKLQIGSKLGPKSDLLASSFDSSMYEMRLTKKLEETNVENWVDVCKFEHEENWSDINLKISELIEENKKQQAEFIRRNEEKRMQIKALCDNVERLMEENKNLKNKLGTCKTDMNQNQSHLSKLKSLLFGKLLN